MDGVATPAAPEPRRESEVWWRSVYLTGPVVILIALAPYTRLTRHLYQGLRGLGIHDNLWQISMVGGFSIQVALLVVIVLFWEHRPLASIGLHEPELIDLGWGIAAFVIIEVGYIFWSAAATLPPVAAESAQTQLARLASQSVSWKILLFICGAFFEETYFRGYVIERVEEITGSVNIGVFLGTAVDLYIHSVYWGAAVISIAFVQVSLALLYLWRRSVITCVIAHFLLDALT